MKVNLELTTTESLIVLTALTEFVMHPDHIKDKDLAEKVRIDIQKAASKAFKERK